MELVSLKPMLDEARRGGYAVGAFNFCNAETALATIEAGRELRSPIMFITAPMEMLMLGPRLAVQLIRWMANEVDVPVCLHLDHATSIDDIRECIDAGFPSVMIDASRESFEENIRLTRLVVEMARPRGIAVEAELGAVGRVDAATFEGAGSVSGLTDPGQAAEFVERTGIDALAVAIGNAHGIYTQRPVLDFERLEAITNAVPVPIVLHGGSGTEPWQLEKAVQLGICKVNVASELARAYLNGINGAMEREKGNIWYSFALNEGKEAVKQVVARWMRQLGSAGRCGTES